MFREVMIQMFNNYLHKLTLVATCLLVPAALALEADRLQRVVWNADGGSTTRIEGDMRILEMVDNVRVSQGTLQIVGDRAIFEYDVTSNELQRVTIFGSPARYQQQLDEDGALVTGSSESVRLYREEDNNETVIEFAGNARISSPDSTTQCSAIIYLVDSDLIRESTGPCEGTLSPSSN